MTDKKPRLCSLCSEPLGDEPHLRHGCNPWPFPAGNSERCCNACDQQVVTPARIALLMRSRDLGRDLKLKFPLTLICLLLVLASQPAWASPPEPPPSQRARGDLERAKTIATRRARAAYKARVSHLRDLEALARMERDEVRVREYRKELMELERHQAVVQHAINGAMAAQAMQNNAIARHEQALATERMANAIQNQGGAGVWNLRCRNCGYTMPGRTSGFVCPQCRMQVYP